MKTRVACTALLLLTGAAAQAGGPSARDLAYTCAGCHGTDGSSVGPSSPHIAGMAKDYFIDAMKAYRADQRNPTIMNRIAKGYTDEQIAGMAEFFAGQGLRLTAQTHDPALAQAGARHHEAYCEKCHEDGGRKADEGGTLAGQWMPYLRLTLADFQSGGREMPKKMKRKLDEAVQTHGEGAVEALIQFYGSQK